MGGIDGLLVGPGQADFMPRIARGRAADVEAAVAEIAAQPTREAAPEAPPTPPPSSPA